MFRRWFIGCMVAVVLPDMGCGPSQPAGQSTARPSADQQGPQSLVRVLVSVAGVPVLQYEGSTLEAALAGANKLKPSKALSDSIVVDDKKPLFGTLSAKIDIYEMHRSGGVSSSPHYEQQPVQLVLVRKSRDAIEWELTPEAVAAIQGVKD